MLKKEVLIDAQPQFNSAIGEDIGYEVGAKMIKDYFDKYQETGSHFIGRDILLKILNQPGCEGIRVFNALNEKNQKTFVIVGYNNIGQAILEVTTVAPTGQLTIENGVVADRSKNGGWYDDIFIR